MSADKEDPIKTHSIYKITNLTNGKIYIGQTSQNPAEKRFKHHKFIAKAGPYKYIKHFNALQRAIHEYGADVFIFEVIEKCYSLNASNNREIFYINYYKTNIYKYGTEYGYNMNDGGNCSRPHSEETKEILRQKNLGNKNPAFGTHHTDEWKAAISEKMSKENNPSWNKPTALEVREKQSEVHLKNVDVYKNQKHSEEIINKIKEARKNQDRTYKIDPEIKKELLHLFNSGILTKRQLAEKFSLKLGTVRRIITKAKKKLLKSTVIKSPKRLLKIEKSNLLKDYDTGKYTYAQLANKYDISQSSVYNIIKKVILLFN